MRSNGRKRISMGYEDEEKKRKRELEERISQKRIQLRQEAEYKLEQARLEGGKQEGGSLDIQEVALGRKELDALVSFNDNKAKTLVLLEAELDNIGLNGDPFNFSKSRFNLNTTHQSGNSFGSFTNNMSFSKSLCRSHYRSNTIEYLSINSEKDHSCLQLKIQQLGEDEKKVEESIDLEINANRMILNMVEELKQEKRRTQEKVDKMKELSLKIDIKQERLLGMETDAKTKSNAFNSFLDHQKKEIDELMDFKRECFEKKANYMKENHTKLIETEKVLGELMVIIEDRQKEKEGQEKQIELLQEHERLKLQTQQDFKKVEEYLNFFDWIEDSMKKRLFLNGREPSYNIENFDFNSMKNKLLKSPKINRTDSSALSLKKSMSRNNDYYNVVNRRRSINFILKKSQSSHFKPVDSTLTNESEDETSSKNRELIRRILKFNEYHNYNNGGTPHFFQRVYGLLEQLMIASESLKSTYEGMCENRQKKSLELLELEMNLSEVKAKSDSLQNKIDENTIDYDIILDPEEKIPEASDFNRDLSLNGMVIKLNSIEDISTLKERISDLENFITKCYHSLQEMLIRACNMATFANNFRVNGGIELEDSVNDIIKRLQQGKDERKAIFQLSQKTNKSLFVNNSKPRSRMQTPRKESKEAEKLERSFNLKDNNNNQEGEGDIIQERSKYSEIYAQFFYGNTDKAIEDVFLNTLAKDKFFSLFVRPEDIQEYFSRICNKYGSERKGKEMSIFLLDQVKLKAFKNFQSKTGEILRDFSDLFNKISANKKIIENIVFAEAQEFSPSEKYQKREAQFNEFIKSIRKKVSEKIANQNDLLETEKKEKIARKIQVEKPSENRFFGRRLEEPPTQGGNGAKAGKTEGRMSSVYRNSIIAQNQQGENKSLINFINSQNGQKLPQEPLDDDGNMDEFFEIERSAMKKEYELKDEIVAEVKKNSKDYNQLLYMHRPDSGDKFKTLLSKTFKDNSDTLKMINKANHSSLRNQSNSFGNPLIGPTKQLNLDKRFQIQELKLDLKKEGIKVPEEKEYEPPIRQLVDKTKQKKQTLTTEPSKSLKQFLESSKEIPFMNNTNEKGSQKRYFYEKATTQGSNEILPRENRKKPANITHIGSFVYSDETKGVKNKNDVNKKKIAPLKNSYEFFRQDTSSSLSQSINKLLPELVTPNAKIKKNSLDSLDERSKGNLFVQLDTDPLIVNPLLGFPSMNINRPTGFIGFGNDPQYDSRVFTSLSPNYKFSFM